MSRTVTVKYWRGTMELEGTATTYAGALRIADRNQNTWMPRFYDARGTRLHDDGNGLRYETDDLDETAYLSACSVYVVSVYS